MIDLILVNNSLLIYNMQFLLSKTYDPPLAATDVRLYHDEALLTNALLSDICL